MNAAIKKSWLCEWEGGAWQDLAVRFSINNDFSQCTLYYSIFFSFGVVKYLEFNLSQTLVAFGEWVKYVVGSAHAPYQTKALIPLVRLDVVAPWLANQCVLQ